MGQVVKNASITRVKIQMIDTVSGHDIPTNDYNLYGTSFSIVPATIVPYVVTQFTNNSSSAKLTLFTQFGNNTSSQLGSTPTIQLNGLTFSTVGSVGIKANAFTLYEEGFAGEVIS